MHALRLAIQGKEFVEAGRISVPVPEPERALLRDLRAGLIPMAQALEAIAAGEADLEAAIDRCDARADPRAIDRLLMNAHQAHWSAAGAPHTTFG